MAQYTSDAICFSLFRILAAIIVSIFVMDQLVQIELHVNATVCVISSNSLQWIN